MCRLPLCWYRVREGFANSGKAAAWYTLTVPAIVVILGAGTSADFGVPTLRSVFKDAYAALYLQQNPQLHKCIQSTFWGPRGCTLQSSERSLTIEEMLTILRDWEGPRENFSDFRRQLYVLIYKAVFEGKSSKGQHLNRLIQVCEKRFDHTTWGSFNWDCIFESSFYYQSGDPGPYGGRHNPSLVIDLDGWRPGTPKHTLLKLHGSINWWMVNGKPSYLSFGGNGPLMAMWTAYEQRACGQDFPMILEPSAYKYNDNTYMHLKGQWAEFFRRLCEADCVIVAGYSLPEADTLARSKILTSFQANPKSKWLQAISKPSVKRS
jgi:hypothetical protein